MKVIKKDYVPEDIIFLLPENSELPEILGEVEDLDKCQKLIGSTFVAESLKHKATRYMDMYEKECVRQEYQNELETIQPELDKRLYAAREKFEEAKSELKAIEEQLNAPNIKVHDLAKEVRIGTKELQLDPISTWRIALNDRYYYLTYMQGRLMVADIQNIPDNEKSEIFNSQARNEEALVKLTEMLQKAI